MNCVNKAKPELVIMAAGMGSRYGGLKQMDPMDDEGHIIIDFSLYDAYKAGFETVNFIIKPELEEDFREVVGNRVEKYMKVRYLHQRMDDLPEGFSLPEGRQKPWGTGHAILACRDAVKANFAVINADDYYGQSAFRCMYEALENLEDGACYQYTMLGYRLINTLAEVGSVCRGECAVDSCGKLQSISERIGIERREDIIGYPNGDDFVELAPNTVVSMNLWGFTPSIFAELERRFVPFLEKGIVENPMKCEYYLPSVVDQLLSEGKAEVCVMESRDRWYGVTYKEDKPVVKAAFAEMKQEGKYPAVLLD